MSTTKVGTFNPHPLGTDANCERLQRANRPTSWTSRVGVVSAALVGALTFAGCGQPTSPPVSNPGTPALTSVSGPGEPASQGSVSPGSPTGTRPTSQTDVSGQRYCSPGQVQVSVTEVPGSAATSHYAVAVRVTNTSDQPCEVSGYPGFSQISAGAVLGAPADRADAAVNRIVLRAGQAGVATVQVTKGEPYEGVAACQMTPFVAWRVYLPNQTEAIDVPAQGFGCANPQTHLLTVRPFEAA